MNIYLNIFSLMIYLILGCILVIGNKRRTSVTSDEYFQSLNSLRGLFAIEIVIGHCVRYESSLLTPLGNFMLISVGFFFYVSGFGLARSYHTKPDYMRSFILHRFLHLIYVAVIALLITTAVALLSPIYTGYRDIPTTPALFLSAVRFRTNWYVRELLILYLLFYLIYRFFAKKRLTLLSCSMIVLAIILYTTGYTRCFLASMICFPLGIFSYENYDRIRAFLSTLRGKLISLLILIAGFALSYLNYEVLLNISFQSSEGIKAIFNNVLCLGFTGLLWIFLDNYKPGNSILKFLTRISTEIYFMQFIFIAIAEEMKLAYPVKIIMVVGMDILVSLLWNMTEKRLRHR